METLQIIKVIKVGTSLAVVLPVEILRGLSIQRGDYVAYGVYHNDVICLRKISDAEMIQIKPPQIKTNE